MISSVDGMNQVSSCRRVESKTTFSPQLCRGRYVVLKFQPKQRLSTKISVNNFVHISGKNVTLCCSRFLWLHFYEHSCWFFFMSTLVKWYLHSRRQGVGSTIILHYKSIDNHSVDHHKCLHLRRRRHFVSFGHSQSRIELQLLKCIAHIDHTIKRVPYLYAAVWLHETISYLTVTDWSSSIPHTLLSQANE